MEPTPGFDPIDTGTDTGTDKAGWRRWAATRPVAPFDPEPLLDALGRFLAEHAGGWVLTYRALAHEVDVEPLERRPSAGPFALTRTPADGADRRLTVHPASAPTERHRWGFDQPVADAPLLDPAEVRVVLVPGVLFDRRGGRLGHGLGYYDRLLARLAPTALRIGVVPDARVVERLPTDDHDVAMTHLATEHGVEPCPVAQPDRVSGPGSAGSGARPSP